ncbi:MAG: potassium channel family protein [Gallionella sp.]
MFSILFALISLHTMAMMFFEKMSFANSLWLTLTTVTTVGYGDLSASTAWGRASTVILIYLMGIALLAQMAAEFFEYRISVREKKRNGTWRWVMQAHLLIINIPNDNAVGYLTKMVDQIRISPELGDIPVQILTTEYSEGLPAILAARGVVHHSGMAQSNDNLECIDVAAAKYIFILAEDTCNATSDSLTFDVLTRINEIGTSAFIVVEVVNDENRQRMQSAGADAVIRPVRAYPEFPVRAMVAPGTEQVLEMMFTHEGDHMVRYDVDIDKMPWSELVCRLMTQVGCLAVAYTKADGRVDTNPLATKLINTQSIICLVNQEKTDINNMTINAALS